MNRKLRTLPLLVALALVGCQNDAKNPAPSATTSPKPAPTTGTPETPDQTPPATVSLDQLPSDLKNEAFSYYGLGYSKPMDMEVVDSSQPGTMTGAQTITLKEIKDGKAVFQIERTGNLAQLGAQEVTLEKDGIYVTASDVAKVNHDLELPNDLSAGKTWKNRMVVDQPGREVEMDSTFKIVGERKVKTKVGDRNALLITSTGQGKMQGQKVRMVSENYYVRDIGGVKSVIKIVYPDGKVRTMTIQETK
jgi:hypothetical protein